jgi:hypothetical protein
MWWLAWWRVFAAAMSWKAWAAHCKSAASTARAAPRAEELSIDTRNREPVNFCKPGVQLAQRGILFG